jgi:non-ribosomal peptide synthetase component F
LKAGGAYVPLDVAVPPARRCAILADAAAHVLVTTSALADDFVSAVDHIVCLDSDAPQILGESVDNPGVAVAGENLIYVIFTSGSTAQPKGVAVEHRQLLNYINAIDETLALPAASSFATISTLCVKAEHCT